MAKVKGSMAAAALPESKAKRQGCTRVTFTLLPSEIAALEAIRDEEFPYARSLHETARCVVVNVLVKREKAMREKAMREAQKGVGS